MSIRHTFLLMPLLFGLSACDESPTAPSEVVERTWRLVSIQHGAAPATNVDRPDRYRLELREDGRASVASDCNSCGGTYALTGTTLRFGPLACTRAFCGDASLDSEYTRALQQIETFAVVDGELVLSGPGVTLRFRE